MKKTGVFILTFVTCIGIARASDHLEIRLAQLLPDYNKSLLLSWKSAGENRSPAQGTFVVADFNGDGRPDVAQLEFPLPWPPSGNTDIGVFLQDPDGKLTKKTVFPIYTTKTIIFLVADFNIDGKADILANDVDRDLVVALGQGDGTFNAAQPSGFSACYYPAIGELTGDAYPDLVAGAAGNGLVQVLAGKGDGTFVLHTNLNAFVAPEDEDGLGGGHGAGAIIVGDINGDGNADILVASPLNVTTKVGTLSAFLGNGHGTFAEPVMTQNVAAWRGAGADFNGDGFLDYAGDRLNSSQLEIWLGSGGGKFVRRATYSLSDIKPVTVDVADFNADGILDLSLPGEVLNGCCDVPLSIFLGKGDGTFRTRELYAGPSEYIPMTAPAVVADFNRDGRPDLLVHAWSEPNPGITIGINKRVRTSPNAGVQLIMETESSDAKTLEATSDLISWAPMSTNRAPRGTWSIIDTEPGMSQRYYRSRAP